MPVRESNDSSYSEYFEVGPLVDQAIEQQRHLLANKEITVDVKRFNNPSLLGHPQAFAIAVGNLVPNAFEHTPIIKVRLASGSINTTCPSVTTAALQLPILTD